MSPTRGVDPERPRCPTGCGCTVTAGHLLCKPCEAATSPMTRREWRKAWDRWLAHGGTDNWRTYLDLRAQLIEEAGTRTCP